MKPLNAPERKTAFLYFLLFFVITVGLVVLAVFFGMQVPFKQNQQLQQKVATLQNEVVFADNFSNKMTTTTGILDTVNKAGVQAELLDQNITDGLKNMTSLLNSDTAADKQFYGGIIKNLTELQFAKKQLRDVSSSNQDIKKYVDEIQDLRSQLAQEKNENMMLRMSVPR